MSKELSVNLKCVVMRSGFFLWIEDAKSEKLKQILMNGAKSTFIELDNRVINTSDIIGIFGADEMDDYFRLKRGQWKCEYGGWHSRNEECNCEKLRREEEWQRSEMERAQRTREREEKETLVSKETIEKIRRDLKEKMVIK